MTGAELVSMAVEVVVLGGAAAVMLSGRKAEREERKAVAHDVKGMAEALIRLEGKCADWEHLERLDDKVNDHETRITVIERGR